jgi:hypothetical protein
MPARQTSLEIGLGVHWPSRAPRPCSREHSATRQLSRRNREAPPANVAFCLVSWSCMAKSRRGVGSCPDSFGFILICCYRAKGMWALGTARGGRAEGREANGVYRGSRSKRPVACTNWAQPPGRVQERGGPCDMGQAIHIESRLARCALKLAPCVNLLTDARPQKW